MNRKQVAEKIVESFMAQGIGCDKAGSKGDGFFIQGMGFVKFEAARKLADVKKHTEKIQRNERQQAWGELAWVAGINGLLKK